jgi:hypothetical protein
MNSVEVVGSRIAVLEYRFAAYLEVRSVVV